MNEINIGINVQNNTGKTLDTIKSDANEASKAVDNLSKSAEKAADALDNMNKSAGVDGLEKASDSLGKISGKATDVSDALERVNELISNSTWYDSGTMDSMNRYADSISYLEKSLGFDMSRFKTPKIEFPSNMTDSVEVLQDAMQDYVDWKDWLKMPENTGDIDSALNSLEEDYNSISESMSEAADAGNDFTDALNNPEIISGVGYVKEASESQKEAADTFNDAAEEIKKAQEEISDAVEADESHNQLNEPFKIPDVNPEPDKIPGGSAKNPNMVQTLAGLELLNKAVEPIVSTFDRLGDLGLDALKGIAKGAEFAAHSVKKLAEAGLDHISEKLEPAKKFADGIKSNIAAIGSRWDKMLGRIARTGTFMVVRKALTHVIDNVNEAVESLAKYSNSIDGINGKFNGAMSVMTSSGNYLAASLVAAFEPILTVVVPILDTLISWIAKALSAVNQFFSALAGFTTFTTPKFKMTNYAESLNKKKGGSGGGGSSSDNANYNANILGMDEANVIATNSTDKLTASLDNETKAAQRALRAIKKYNTFALGIDELNIFNVPEKSKSGGGGGGTAGDPFDWEQKEISGWAKKMADTAKKLWKQFTDPFKKAWDAAGDYVLDSWKYMAEKLKDLAKDVTTDFLKVWNEDKTVDMFTRILRIVGDIGLAAGNLARQFDIAWKTNNVGLHIFENIRDIFYELVVDAERVADYLVQWTANLNFYPMLASFEQLTRSLVPVFDKIGDMFYDAMVDGVLRFAKFFIEDEIPHINNAVRKIADNIDWDKLERNFDTLVKATEGFFERVSTAEIDLFEHVGIDVGNFLNSKAFQSLVNQTEWILNNFPADDIAGIFEDVADGIEAMAESLAKFIGSRTFRDFLQSLINFAKKLNDKDFFYHVFKSIGDAIVIIADSLVRFVSSKGFQNFLDGLIDFLDGLSGRDIANILEGIAIAVGLFKFTAFTVKKIEGFSTFAIALTKLSSISPEAIAAIAAACASLGSAMAVIGTVGISAGAGIAAIKSIIEDEKALHNGADPNKVLGPKFAPQPSYGSAGIAPDEFSDTYQKTMTMGEGLRELFGNIGKDIDSLKDDKIPQFIQSVGSSFGEVKDTIGSSLSSVGASIESAFSTAQASVTNTISNISGAVYTAFDNAKIAIADWFANNIAPLFDMGRWYQLAQQADAGIRQKWDEFTAFFTDTLPGWWDTNIAPWFTADKWHEVADGIKVGISQKWDEFAQWWNGTGVPTWWNTKVKPWFTTEKWKTVSYGMKAGISEKWNEFSDWWTNTGFYNWWNNHVKKWFDKKEWTFPGIKEGLSQAWNDAIDAIKNIWNGFASWFNEKMKFTVPKASVFGHEIGGQTITLGHLPTFAADGGLFDSGDLFIAREAGPEMVGTIGSHTAVANNDQIVEAVAAGVANANEEVVARLSELISTVNNKDMSVNIGDREIALANNRGQEALGRSIIT